MFTSDPDGDKGVCSVVQTDLAALHSATDLFWGFEANKLRDSIYLGMLCWKIMLVEFFKFGCSFVSIPLLCMITYFNWIAGLVVQTVTARTTPKGQTNSLRNFLASMSINSNLIACLVAQTVTARTMAKGQTNSLRNFLGSMIINSTPSSASASK